MRDVFFSPLLETDLAAKLVERSSLSGTFPDPLQCGKEPLRVFRGTKQAGRFEN